MADVSIELVREFFEESGFLVKINRKYRGKHQSAEIDLAIINPKPESSKLGSFILSSRSIKSISRAIVKVKGWHTESFSPSVLTAFPKIFRFVTPDVIKLAQEFFGTQEFLKILVVPSLPATKQSIEKSIDILKAKGVDGVIEFKTILEAIADMVMPNRNYFESDLLQMVRLFKLYDMLRLGQLELFGHK